jgi:hypothetical protein
MRIRLSSHFKFKVYPKLLVLGSLLVLCALVPHVSLAYSLQMAQPHPFPELADSGLPPFAFNARIVSRSTQPAGLKPFSGAHSKVFISRLLRHASLDSGHLLWSMYPASVRGRTFGSEGGDPTMSSLSGGW